MRNSPDVSFGNVSRDDFPALEEFAKKQGIKLRSEMAEDARPLFQDDAGGSDSSDDEEGESTRKRKRTVLNADMGGDDDDSDEEDDDFNPEAKKAKAEGASDGTGSDVG
jgi:hypothetical protein